MGIRKNFKHLRIYVAVNVQNRFFVIHCWQEMKHSSLCNEVTPIKWLILSQYAFYKMRWFLHVSIITTLGTPWLPNGTWYFIVVGIKQILLVSETVCEEETKCKETQRAFYFGTFGPSQISWRIFVVLSYSDHNSEKENLLRFFVKLLLFNNYFSWCKHKEVIFWRGTGKILFVSFFRRSATAGIDDLKNESLSGKQLCGAY